ncbi:hypothetical protein Tco_1255608 [Tanacetum coccineum]
MSSPNHPISNIEDAFSSNFPDYIPAFLTMSQLHQEILILALLNNSLRLVPIALTNSFIFHDDPYMKARAQIAKLQRKQLGNNSKMLWLSKISRMPPKRTSTSKAPAMTQAAIRKLVADSVSPAARSTSL